MSWEPKSCGRSGYANEETLVAFDFPMKESNGPRRSHEEDIYEDLCYVTLRSGAASTLFASPPLETRDYCIRELVETENNYIEALNMIVRFFLRPLKTVLKSEERIAVFLHVKELLEIHTGFHSELFKACTSSQCRLSDCFLRWKDKFVIYGDYCANLPKAQALIEEICTKNELVNSAVIRCQFEASGGKFKLRDLLSLPMQRILKYHLLLNELLKHTIESHEDYNGLQKAYESMIDLGQYINEVKRDSETLQIIADIQTSITDLDMPENIELKDYGRLLKDGELKIRSHNNKLKSRYIFIFDKVMLMCKSIKGEQYSFKEAVILLDYDIEDVPVTTSKYLKDSWSHYWYLVHRAEKTSFMFCAKTEEAKKKWIEAIQKAFDNVYPAAAKNTDHSFMMHTFERPTACGDCDKLLRGIFYQGYKCTVCNVAVHKGCIATVRSCGAPSLPPRPPVPPSSPSITSINSADEDPTRSASELLFRRTFCNGFDGNKCRALISYDGNRLLNQVSFVAGDPLLVFQKNAFINDDGTWHEGKVLRTGEEGLFRSDLVEPLDIRLQPYEESSPPLGPNGSPSISEFSLSLNLESHQWFAGTMNREMAQSILDRLPSGTFLVRISPKQKGNYAISLNYNGQVKHMRVCMTEDRHFYLSQKKFFKNIVELVKWYEEDTLAESFNGLNITLSTPYKRALPVVEPIAFAIAVYGFTGNSANLLSLRKGDKVAVLSKAGEEKGWWKGQIDSRIGYFPCAYVSEIQD